MRFPAFRKFRPADAWDPFAVFQHWRSAGPGVLLESARRSSRTGRTSLVAKDPFLIFEAKGDRVVLREGRSTRVLRADPFKTLSALLEKYATPALPGFPPFTGGAVGYVGYEAKNIIEPGLFRRLPDDVGLPDITFLFFDEAVVWDHEAGELTLFAGGASAGPKLDRLERILEETASCAKSREEDAPVRSAGEITRTFSRQAFIRSVKKVKAFIRRGEIFQANLSQRFSFKMDEDASGIYPRLRRINPSSFFGILEGGSFQILSGSPERLVRLENGVIETRPIAGTRSRGKTAREDAALSLELLLSEKERAEHIMLVDLERNDMGRVAEYGTVHADELMAVEDYSHVKHIVSNVRGSLRGGLGAVDVFKAFFPGGTITGAPKIRCMQIIDELEPVARGPYTGSLGYFSFSGNMDFNILIRSLVLKDGRGHLQAGAGIVADSDPGKEYDETLYKAEALWKALFGASLKGLPIARALRRVS
ncbi:MAG: anthranilate synthase component I family protein [Candidatus Omnitrophota bacterium]